MITRVPRHPVFGRVRRGVRRAYTLIELLLVISVLVLVLAIAVPSFTSLLYSSDQSLAENAVRGGLLSARDVALRSARGQDSAAVFFYDKGKTTILPCSFAGQLDDMDVNGNVVKRDLFVPAAGFDATQLPRDWNARGFAPPNTIGGQWYESIASSLDTTVGNWVLPETSFYNEEERAHGRFRQTFMIRFEGSTGQMKMGDTSLALVLAPTPGSAFRQNAPFNYAGCNPLQEADPMRFARRLLAAPSVGPGSQLKLTPNERRELLGDVSSDTVLARPVTQLAVCSERRILGALGVNADQTTRTMYIGNGLSGPQLVPGVAPATLRDLNLWIQGNLMNGPDLVPSDARVFFVDHLAGSLKEISQ